MSAESERREKKRATAVKPYSRPIPNECSIEMYFHCGKCLDEKPAGISPKDWARVNVGWTKLGLQVWCVRHEINVAHIDFLGRKGAINTTAAEAKQ